VRTMDDEVVAHGLCDRWGDPLLRFIPVKCWTSCFLVSRQFSRMLMSLLLKWRNIALGTYHRGARDALLCNRHDLVGHPAWGSALRHLGVERSSLLVSKRVVPCSVLRCPVTCHPDGLSVGVALQELDLESPESTQNDHIMMFLHTCTISDVTHHIDPLLRVSHAHKQVFDLALLPHCATCMRFATKVFWRAKSYSQHTICEAVLSVLPEAVRKELLKSFSFALLLEDNILRRGSTTSRCEELLPCLLPGSFDIIVEAAFINRIAHASGASQPLVVPLRVRNRESSESRVQEVLYKPTSCLKDRCAIDIIRYLRAKAGGFTDTVTDYDVIIISESSAFIVMVPSAVTLYSINKASMDICSYVSEFNLSNTIGKVRDRFIKGLAFSSCVCLFLGVGDRHLENVMVAENGEVFNIDFEYILGERPNGHILQQPWQLRVTPDMIRMMGGDGSAGVDSFRDLCTDLMVQFKTRISDIVPILRGGYPEGDDRPALFMAQWTKKRMERIDILIDTEAMNGSRRTLYRVLDWLHDIRKGGWSPH